MAFSLRIGPFAMRVAVDADGVCWQNGVLRGHTAFTTLSRGTARNGNVQTPSDASDFNLHWSGAISVLGWGEAYPYPSRSEPHGPCLGPSLRAALASESNQQTCKPDCGQKNASDLLDLDKRWRPPRQSNSHCSANLLSGDDGWRGVRSLTQDEPWCDQELRTEVSHLGESMKGGPMVRFSVERELRGPKNRKMNWVEVRHWWICVDVEPH